MSLSTKAARGGIVMLSGQVIKVALQFLNLILLARLLQPEDFGLVAMVIAVYGVCDILLDFGLSTASIQVKEISKEQISNLFWINVIIGLLLTMLSYISASWISHFYGRPELLNIAQSISIVFLLNGISAQYKAQLNRNFKFANLVSTDIIATFLSICVGIYFAYNGHSYWSIVYQQISQALIQMILYAWFGRWLPGMPARNASMSGFLKFGWGLAGSQLLGYFSRSFPSILIGNQIGANQLGFFDRANKMLMLPLNQLSAPSSSVAVPILSRLEFEDQDKYNRFLLFGQNIIVHAVVLSLVLACCQTEYLVGLLLGMQWVNIAPVFRAISFAGVFLVLSYASYWVFLSKGITGSLFKLGLVSRPILIIITCCGLPWGVVGVAYAYSLGLMISWLLGIFWLRKTGVPVLQMIINPLVVSTIYYGAAFLSNVMVNAFFDNGYLNILIGWAILLSSLVVAYLVIPLFKKSINQVFQIKEYIRKK